MHKNLVNSRLKRTLLAAAISALSFSATAAGLGRITVLSGLGQPLRAEVEIAAAPEEIQNMTARLASADAFRQAGIDYSPSVSGLRMSVERRGSGAVVRVSSDRPINEPFVDMLVELNWSAGRLIREYTFLLDPPDTGTARASVAVASPEMRYDQSGVRAGSPAVRRPAAARIARPAAASPGGGRAYMVQSGDTLNRIAMENRPDGVSMEQMLMALFQGNRSAFEGDDMNRLQAGKILRIPDAEGVRQVAGEGGRQQLVGQSSDFGRYSRKLAEQAAAGPAKEAPTQQGSGGKIGAKVEDRAQSAAGPSDRLKVSKSEEGVRAGGAGGEKSVARLQALEEDLVSRDKALSEANTRLAELEKSIKELQRLVELKSQGMAQMQSEAPPPAVVPQPPVAKAPVEPVAAPAIAAEKPELPKAPEPVPEVRPVPPPPPPVPEPAAVKPPEVQSPADDTSLLIGGGGILALLLGWGGYKLYQRRNGQGAPTTTPALSEFGDGSSSVFGSAVGQSVDTGSSSQIQTDFSQSGLSSIDTDEGVDPVAEADVYMAYGRDAQAEEILLDALKTDPGRTGVHLKLLEIYAQRKNLKQFETTATELYSLTGGNGQDWEKAAALGRKVDPDSPLYRIPAPGVPSGPTMAMSAAAASTPGPQTIAGGAAAATGFVQAGTGRVPVAESAFMTSESSQLGSDDPLESPSQLKDTWALPGDLNQYASMEDIERVVSAESHPAQPAASFPAAGILDFDLDLNVEDDSSSARTVALGGGSPTASSGLDFDLGFDQVSQPEMGATLVAGDVMPNLEATSTRPQRLAADFSLPDASDLDFEISSEFGEHRSGAPSDQTVDVDLTATLAEDSIREPVDAATVDLERTSFDSSLLDFDFELDDKVEAQAPVKAAFAPAADLKALDLELKRPVVASAIELLDAGPPTEPPLDLDLQQEVATKLELARAYEEMGDKDGARELVEEVLREGSGLQQDEARAILARLS